jgi:hypothetical protein
MQNMFTPNSINNRQPRGQMAMAGKTPEMRSMRPHLGAGMQQQQQPRMQNDRSQGSDNDNADFIQQTNPNLNAGKKIQKEITRTPEGNMQYGSGDDSQGEGEGQQPVYDYQYGMQQHSPYQHPGYNYQMSPPQQMGGQGYGMYPPYSPMMNQRPPMKQYQHPSAYNYQDRGGHASGMNIKGMQRPPTEYYGEYKYGAGAMPQMRGGHMESPQGFHPARAVKGGQKQMPMGQQHPGYQYTNQHMSPMYQHVQHPGHYDPRSPYDYAPYKSKAGEVGMSPGQSPAFYNYKPVGMPPYSYAGGQFAKSQEQDDADIDPAMRQQFRDEQQPGANQKGKKAAMKPRPTEDLGAKDLSNPSKIGKAKQFAEDFDSNNMDN